MKVRTLKVYSIIYGLTVVCFSFYWASNFDKYVRFKGDDFIVFAQSILVITYIFLLTVQLTVKRKNYFIAISIPIIVTIAAFCIGFILLLVTGLGDEPWQYILTYGGLYGLLLIFAVNKLWGQALTKVIKCDKCFKEEIKNFVTNEEYEKLDLELTKKITNDKSIKMKEFVSTAWKDKGYQVYECLACGQLWKLSKPEDNDKGYFLRMTK